MPTAQRRRTLVVLALTTAVVALVAGLALGAGPQVRALVGLDAVRGDTPGPHHRFLQTQGGGRPVGWDPCRPLRYVVDPTGAPDGWRSVLEEAVARTADASGLRLVGAGTTGDRRFSQRRALGRDPDPVLVGWADADEVPGLAGDVAGVGGAVSVRQGRAGRYFTTGSLVLDADEFARLDDAPRGREVQVAIVMHELGHVVGLDHVGDRGELMHAEGVTRSGWGPGDRQGLAALGAVPCIDGGTPAGDRSGSARAQGS